MGIPCRSRKSGRAGREGFPARFRHRGLTCWRMRRHDRNTIELASMAFVVMPFPAWDPTLVQVEPLAIRWYALAYIVGILLGWIYARTIVRNERLWGGPAPLTVV